MTATTGKVESIEQVSSNIYKIILKPSQAISFKAGQYLKVVMSEQDKRPFSIANASHQDTYIELHIGATPENPYAFEVLSKCRDSGSLQLELGQGEAFLRNSPLPAIIVAGGTGYSYAKSVLYSLLHEQPQRQVSLYWGAKKLEDLYELAELQDLSRQFSNFTFKPVVEHPPADWTGHTGWVHLAVLKDYETLEAMQVYTAGRFEMAGAIRADYVPKGLDVEHLFGDAFSYI